jgi:hypothetical protein
LVRESFARVVTGPSAAKAVARAGPSAHAAGMCVCLPDIAEFEVVRPMSRQIGPWSSEPLAVMLEWRLRELDDRLRVIESRLAAWPEEYREHGELADLTAEARKMAAELLAQADAVEEHAITEEHTVNAGVAD